jgi:aryl-alcohol dehydrogenase-like predicted oxidoreductase
VSRLGLGLAALGRPGYINLGHGRDLGRDRSERALERRTRSVLDLAWQSGIRYFDAARSYGLAERFLARWLGSSAIRPGSAVVGSKWGYTYTAGWRVDAERHEVKDHSLAVLRRQVAESAALLGPHLALYQIHSATAEGSVLDDDAVIDELARMRDGSLSIGLTASGPRQAEVIERALALAPGGRPLFASMQATYNVLETSAAVALARASGSGATVIVKEALANGRLTGRNRDPGFAARRRVLARMARARGATLDALALAYVLARPWADVVLSGAASRRQLASNLKALSITLDGDELAVLDDLAETPGSYWATRSRLPWN